MENQIKKKIMQRFIQEEFMTPVEFAEGPRDIELLVSQEMVKIIDNVFPFSEQLSYIEKL